MSDTMAMSGEGRGRLDYTDVPDQATFFAKIAQREATLKALRENGLTGPAANPALDDSWADSYRRDLYRALNRQAPFDRYLLKVWSKVQSAGWETGEKYRLAATFGTSDDWKIAYMMAKVSYDKMRAESLRVQYAEARGDDEPGQWRAFAAEGAGPDGQALDPGLAGFVQRAMGEVGIIGRGGGL